MNTGERRFGRDERGAVLVLGVFMAACVAGMLWYLAGIGDAILYRQRLQEASDATAFSAAVLHARGMNLIVMLNLIMACILGVRVAMRAVQAGLVIIGTIASLIPPFTAGAPIFGYALRMESAIRSTRSVINNSIKALGKAQDGLKLVAPAAALAGSYQVGSKYGPIVEHSAAGNPFTRYGLPVEKGTTDRLCQEAGEAVVGIMLWAVPGNLIPSFAAEQAKSVLGKAVKAGGVYFCELGKGTPPDFGDDLAQGAEQGCDQEKGDLDTKAGAAESAFTARCQQLGPACDGAGGKKLSPAQQAELANLRATRDSARSAASGFDAKSCREKKRADADARAKQEGASGPGGGSSTKPGVDAPKPSQAALDAMRPASVAADYRNGVDGAQLLAVSKGSDALLNLAPPLVKAGAWKRGQAIEIPATAYFSFAQAEFFYDCSGRWSSNDCNGKGGDGAEAMWHFRWRARLRRYNAPFGTSGNGLDNLSEGLARGAFGLQAAKLDPSVALAGDNAIILKDLTDAIRGGDLIIH